MSPDFAELFSFLQVHIRRRALLLFLTDLSDPILTAIFVEGAPMLARRHVVTLNTLSTSEDKPLFSGDPPETENQIIERLARHIRWSRQRDLARKLQHLGIQTLPLRTGSAPHDLVENYRAIKKRQLL